MNKTVTITSKNHKYANTYGGEITFADFYTGCKSKYDSCADKIGKAERFNIQCSKNIEIRKRQKEHEEEK